VFIVTSAELFWQHYSSLPPGQRHHYEIIRAGCPCHAYFGARVLCSGRAACAVVVGARIRSAAVLLTQPHRRPSVLPRQTWSSAQRATLD
jgi:hypothetical protein